MRLRFHTQVAPADETPLPDIGKKRGLRTVYDMISGRRLAPKQAWNIVFSQEISSYLVCQDHGFCDQEPGRPWSDQVHEYLALIIH